MDVKYGCTRKHKQIRNAFCLQLRLHKMITLQFVVVIVGILAQSEQQFFFVQRRSCKCRRRTFLCIKSEIEHETIIFF